MTRRNNLLYSKTAFAVALVALASQTAFALREGALGNAPIRDPNWAKGAAAVFNHRARISYWVGPGPGYYTGEFSGNATALSEVLSDFATIESKSRRLVVRDGVRSSGFKQPLDWVFNVWVPSAWERPTGAMVRTFHRDPNKCPPPEIIVYTGGNVRWSDVTVPNEIEVVDERLEMHGFNLADGLVLEGTVVDLDTQQPLVARVRALTPRSSKGEDGFTPVAQTITDDQGHWVLRNVPEGCRRLTIAAEGYMPRSLYAPNTDGQPGWHFFERGLSRPGVVTGRALDKTSGQPLVNVEIRLKGDASGPAADYWRMNRYVTTTDADGHFQFEQVPNGTGTLRVRHGSYCLPGSTLQLTTPARDVDLSLVKSAELRVTVDFTGTDRPETYLVMVHSADGGAALPSREQLQNTVTLVHNAHFATDRLRVEIRPIGANQQVCFADVPPGKYILEGWPSRFGPGGRSTPFKGIGRSKPLATNVKSGRLVEITLPASDEGSSVVHSSAITLAGESAITNIKPARIRVTVAFAGKARPKNYIVELEPDPNGKTSWGGAAQIDAKNRFSFANVPPGRYVLRGHPNPWKPEQQTKPLVVDVKSGQQVEITLPAN